MTSRCGEFLESCTCQRQPTTARDAVEMAARHEASVARAYRSGWPTTTRPRFGREAAALPPLSAQERRAALAGGPVGAGLARTGSAPFPVDPTGRGWEPIVDTIRATRRGAA